MLVEFDFHGLRLRYVRAAMASIAKYRPDGMNVASMFALRNLRSSNRRQRGDGLAFSPRVAMALCTLLSLTAPLSATAAPEKSVSPKPVREENLAPTRGRLQLPITGIVEHIDSFRVPVKDKLQDTGPVVLTLDPVFRGQTILLDFSKREVRINTHLLMDSPLLRKLGARATPIAVLERGTFTVKNVTRTRDGRSATMELAYETDSAGTIKNGPFNGAAFKNKKHHDPHACSYPANTAKSHRISVNLDARGTVVGGSSPPALLCAADRGTLSFSGRDNRFAGYRTGTLASR